MKKNLLLVLAVLSIFLQEAKADQWVEDFESATLTSYGNDDFELNGRVWGRYKAGKINYGESSLGSKCIVINDDTPNAYLRTPRLATCGLVSFKYAYKSGNSANVFVLQSSENGIDWTNLDTHTLGLEANQAFVDYNFQVNSTNSLYLRILSDNQNTHLFIDDFSVTNYLGGNSKLMVWEKFVFVESEANNGDLNDSIAINLLNETFAINAGLLAENIDYTYSNLPEGLNLKIRLENNTLAYLVVYGMANTHQLLNSIDDLSVVFTNSAFVSGESSTVAGSSNNNLSIQFLDPYVNPDVLISEIMYNPPESGTDTLEFLELRNYGTEEVNLKDFYLEGIDFVFPDTVLESGAYMLVAKNATAIFNTFGVTALQWDAGTLQNSGETIILRSNHHLKVDELSYSATGEWDAQANGGGYSLVYCGDDKTMNDIGANWLISQNHLDNTNLYASPGAVDEACVIHANLKWNQNVFTESTDDNGSLSDTLSVTLHNDSFTQTSGVLTLNTHYTVENIPQGLTPVIEITSAQTAWFYWTGNAEEHLSENSISNLNVHFLDETFETYTASQVNGSNSVFQLVFNNPPAPAELEWSSLILKENLSNDGSIFTVIDLNLITAEFSVSNDTLEAGVHYSISNLPEGLSALVVVDSEHSAKIYCVNSANQHTVSDDVNNIQIEFLDEAFNMVSNQIINSTQTLSVQFLDPYSHPDIVISEIMYRSTEQESDSLEFIELHNLENQAVSLDGFSLFGVVYFFENEEIPANSYYVIAKDSAAIFNTFGVQVRQWDSGDLSDIDETVVVYNEGGEVIDMVHYSNMASWGEGTNGQGASLIYCGDNAQDNDVSSAWEASSQILTAYPNLKASPLQQDLGCIPTPSVHWSGTVFTESTNNDGSISNSIFLNLEDVTFSLENGQLQENTHYLVQNLPEGLTLNVVLMSNVQAQLQLTGNAENHHTDDNIDNLSITFVPTAFSELDTSVIANSSVSNLSIQYQNTYSTPTIVWNGEGFDENISNDGTVEDTISIELQNLHFIINNAVLSSENYTVENLPEGLNLQIVVESDTTAEVQISGTVSAHQSINDVSTLSIMFHNSAFSESDLELINGNPKTDLWIHFKDAPQLIWSKDVLKESLENNGQIADSLVLSLKNMYWVEESALNTNSFYSIQNLPEGLNVNFTYYNDTLIVLHFVGNALHHNANNSIDNLEITFLNEAFANNNANEVMNSSQNLSIRFRDAYTQSNVFISEIMYHPPQVGQGNLEYIELCNKENYPVNLEGFTLEGVDYTFENVIIEPDSFIVIAKDSLSMKSAYGLSVLQWSSGDLDNQGQRLALYNPIHQLIDELVYDASDFPVLTNGNGSSAVYCGNSALINDILSYWVSSTSEIANIGGLKGSPAHKDDNCSDDLETNIGSLQLASDSASCHFTYNDTLKVAFQNTGETLLNEGDTLCLEYTSDDLVYFDTIVLNRTLIPLDTYIHTLSTPFHLSSSHLYTTHFRLYYIENGINVAEAILDQTILSYQLSIDIQSEGDTINVNSYPYTLYTDADYQEDYHPQYMWQDGSSYSDLIVNEDAWYKVTLTDDNDCIAEDSVYVRLFSGIENKEQHYSIYPNPVKEVLHIECDNLNQLELIDLNGRVLKSEVVGKGMTQYKWNLEGVKTGLYIVKLYSQDGVYTEKINVGF